ncbi:MAG: tetratricopeptide repeat protein [Paucibacter sp.]|nr:tetratricopeptide repeat protein [Roseateles sp.]
MMYRPLLLTVAMLFSALAQAVTVPLDQAQGQWLAGHRQEAVATVEAELKRSPDDLKLRFALGVYRMELHQTDVAEQIFTALTQDFPDLADPYNNLAVLHAGKGQLDQARADLEQALRLQPDHAQAQENLGDLLLRLALRAYERSQAALPAPSAALAQKLKATQALVLIPSPNPAP